MDDCEFDKEGSEQMEKPVRRKALLTLLRTNAICLNESILVIIFTCVPYLNQSEGLEIGDRGSRSYN